MTIDLALVSVNQGLMWAIMAIGIYITFRILNFADLTAEGSFTLGAAITAKLIVGGVNPIIGTLAAALAGACAGAVTGLLHTKCKIPALLAGILTMIGLYSLNLRIMGKANVPFLKETTILTLFSSLGISSKYVPLIVGFICVAIVIGVLWWFFNTEIGYALRATGNNEKMIRALGVNSNAMKILGLAISNSLIAFSGALVAQYNGTADVGMGTGTIVVGLASVIVGEVIFNDNNNHKAFFSVTLGSILYRIIISFVLTLGLQPTDLRGITAVLLAVALSLPVIKGKVSSMKQMKVG